MLKMPRPFFFFYRRLARDDASLPSLLSSLVVGGGPENETSHFHRLGELGRIEGSARSDFLFFLSVPPRDSQRVHRSTPFTSAKTVIGSLPFPSLSYLPPTLRGERRFSRSLLRYGTPPLPFPLSPRFPVPLRRPSFSCYVMPSRKTKAVAETSPPFFFPPSSLLLVFFPTGCQEIPDVVFFDSRGLAFPSFLCSSDRADS